MEGLTATLSANVYTSKYNTTFTYNPFYGFGFATYPGGYVYRDSFDEYTYNLQQLVRYSKMFGLHNLNLLAGHESYRYHSNDIYGDRKNMFSYFGNRELDGATTLLSNGSYAIGYNTEGWLFRGLYDYDGRYFAQLSYRRDASSRFHPDHRWGNFYSFGGAWMITRESFMNNCHWLQMLKLKFSFGQNGNDNISDFLYTDTYTISKGEGNEIGLFLSNIGNEHITWETATTPAVEPLDEPLPAVVAEGSTVTVTWPAVEHAAAYAYTLVKDGGNIASATVTEPCAVFRSLEPGTYDLSITALSDDENYSDSEPVSLSFTVERQRQVLWSVCGTYASGVTGGETSATLTAYDDGSFSLEAPYGSQTTELQFLVNESGSISVTNHALEYYGYYYLYLDNGDQWGIYGGEGFSMFEGNEEAGEVWFYSVLYDAQNNLIGEEYDVFTWAPEEDPTQQFIDNLCGTYTETTTCYEAFSGSWVYVDGLQSQVTIAQTGENSVSITNFYGWEDTFTATVDAEARTLTIDIKEDWGGYYTFADVTDPTVNVVATVDEEGTITLSNWSAWYIPYSAAYIYDGAVSVLVRNP